MMHLSSVHSGAPWITGLHVGFYPKVMYRGFFISVLTFLQPISVEPLNNLHTSDHIQHAMPSLTSYILYNQADHKAYALLTHMKGWPLTAFI